MKKLNEDITINDPNLAQQYNNGQIQLLNKDKQINALQQQINKLEQSKNDIHKKMAQIEKQASSNQPEQIQQPQQNVAQPAVQPTSESLLVKESAWPNNTSESEYNRLTDELAMLQSVSLAHQGPEHKQQIWDIKSELRLLDQAISSEEYGEDEHFEPKEDNYDANGYRLSEEKNPLSAKNFYNLVEAYVDYDTEALNKDSEYNQEDYIFYVKVSDGHNEFIGKIFKISPDGEWFGIVKDGEDSSFEKISYDAIYSEMDIVKFLEDSYDEVEIIDINEFNNYIEGDTEELGVRDID